MEEIKVEGDNSQTFVNPPEGEVKSLEMPKEITNKDDSEIISLPEDLKGIDPIADQDKLVSILVDKWNTIVTQMENHTILFSKMVVKALDGQDDKTITLVIHKIKEHPDLKLTISKDRIWQGVRLIKARPDLVSAPRIEAPEKSPFYRKGDGTKFYEFYFELHKYNLPSGIRGFLEAQGKSQNWSVSQLSKEIRAYRLEKMDPIQKDRLQKGENIKEILGLVRSLPANEVSIVLEYIKSKVRGGANKTA